MSTDSVFGSAIETFQSSSTLEGIFGSSPCRIYVDEEPEQTDLPLAVVREIQCLYPYKVRRTTSAAYPYVERWRYTVEVIAVGLAAAEADLRAAESVLDFAVLSFASAGQIHVETEILETRLGAVKERTAEGKQVYYAQSRYETEITHDHA